MPPKFKITRETILSKALELVKECGYNGLSARALASAVGSSVQPIYQQFANMEELKEEISIEAQKKAKDFIASRIDKDDFLISLSHSYIAFAKKEPEIFKVVFVSPLDDKLAINSLKSFVDTRNILGRIGEKYTLSDKNKNLIFERVWFYIHGLAEQISYGRLNDYSDTEIQQMINEGVEDISRSLLIRMSLS